MQHRRLWIFSLAILLTVLGIVLPFYFAYQYSWVRAIDIRKEALNEATTRLVQRTMLTFNEARSALFLLNSQHLEPCSPQQIEEMKKLTYENRVIKNIGYIQDGYETCDSYGKHNPEKISFTDEITTPIGIKISLNMPSTYNQNDRVISLRYGNYHVHVYPKDFSDIILGKNIKITLYAKNGVLITSINDPDLELSKNLVFHYRDNLSKNYIYSITPSENFIAIATEHKSYFYETLTKEELILIPFAILTTLFIVAIVIYLLRQQLSITSELDFAIENKKLSVVYQPIVDIMSGVCIGAEALVRWKITKGEYVSPDYFISIAEKSGSISKITKYVINVVVDDMKDILISNRDLHISINFSVFDFQNHDVVNFLESKLKETNINRDQIWIEITERQLLQFKNTADLIEKIRSVNYKLAMDDFGTGYSNLSTLKDFTLDVLKIDKSFVDMIGKNTVTSGITEHIISLAKDLNLKIVAEGIETTEQNDYLKDKMVDYGQGWLYSKALDRVDFINYYKKLSH